MSLNNKTSVKRSSYDPQSAPPPFGHELLPYFGFDSDYVNLNHGSYGSLPLPVKAALDAVEARIEARPDQYHRLEYQSLLKESREQVARLIGAKADECVLVTNTSVGLNTILRNFAWNEGDILVGAATTYNSINKTLEYLHDIHPKITLSTFALHFPNTHAAIVSDFRTHMQSLALPKATEANPHPKIVVVLDSIVSNPGVLLPWQEMVKICKEAGAWSVIDAAHSLGQEKIDLAEVQPDFWVSNCHKWLFAKRGCAVLYVPERNRHIIKASFPTSYAYQKEYGSVSDWLLNFEWNGTIDFGPFITLTDAIKFRQWLGGEEKINAYCHDLALRGGQRLAELLGTEVMDKTGELTLSMVNVGLPLPDGTGSKYGKQIYDILVERLIREKNCFGAIYYHNNKWWTRCSAQIWNDISDFEYLASAIKTICADIRETVLSDDGPPKL